MAVSFIGGGNRSTRRKPLTCHKSLTKFIPWHNIVSSTPRHEWRIWHTCICIQSNLFKQNPLWTNIFVFGKHRCSDYTDYFTKISYIGRIQIYSGFSLVRLHFTVHSYTCTCNVFKSIENDIHCYTMIYL